MVNKICTLSSTDCKISKQTVKKASAKNRVDVAHQRRFVIKFPCWQMLLNNHTKTTDIIASNYYFFLLKMFTNLSNKSAYSMMGRKRHTDM